MSQHDAVEGSSQQDSVTAVDYIENQLRLEREARELMPYDPNECTYEQGELRQPVFACLTCSKENDNQPIGVCYSCSIQCHASHEIVELFSKRSFVCDCGTTRMSKTFNGACNLRRRGEASEKGRRLSVSSTSSKELNLNAEDIPSSSNIYNQNFHGNFCCCEKPYNPLEETGDMLQCYFGFVCGEDWYHDRCIMGITKEAVEKDRQTNGKNMLDKLAPPGEDAEAEQQREEQESDAESAIPHFPKLDNFDVFICWKCISQFQDVFNELEKTPGIVYTKLAHFDTINTMHDWESKNAELEKKSNRTDDEPVVKRMKTEEPKQPQYSFFLANDFREKIIQLYESLNKESRLYEFLTNNNYLFLDDPIYEPPNDVESTTGSILEMGADALQSIPREKAIEGLQAYDKIREKLRDFFKPFAEEGKVVTEQEVRQFFGSMKEEQENELK
ncbi:uncharacterized protein J8A68_000628 [[Candida] subhashii]|uniref:UBR-type domain-containing protein n=1 Tax=[Candida] subhashii TaxID=561895 RepID=A0A8J5QQN3_9ASCO|nr:uncharacterized protein J8A68_000628 [[Candida] subhashii]KAG7665803.1 hypothetical protein J8A68_000628 [[Candida] subhashii]